PFLRERLQPDPRPMILYRRALVVDVDAAIVVLLPALRPRFRSGRFQVLVELPATGLPFLKLRGELSVFGDRAQLRIERFDLLAFDWKDVAIGLALLEAYRDARAREHPVHGERKGRPVGLDHAAEGRDSILRAVYRALHHEVIPRLGAKQAADVERQNALHERVYRRRRGFAFRADLDRLDPLAAIPGCRECGRTQDLPAGSIGDIERQAAISEALIGRLHPRALDRGGANIDVVALRQVSDQFHARFLWIMRVPVAPPALGFRVAAHQLATSTV